MAAATRRRRRRASTPRTPTRKARRSITTRTGGIPATKDNEGMEKKGKREGCSTGNGYGCEGRIMTRELPFGGRSGIFATTLFIGLGSLMLFLLISLFSPLVLALKRRSCLCFALSEEVGLRYVSEKDHASQVLGKKGVLNPRGEGIRQRAGVLLEFFFIYILNIYLPLGCLDSAAHKGERGSYIRYGRAKYPNRFLSLFKSFFCLLCRANVTPCSPQK